MNHFFKKHLWLAAAVISATVPAAYADDLFDDSFFADPAPVDTAKPAEPAKEEKTEQAPAEIATPVSEPAADLNPASAPVEPQLSMDIPAPAAGLDVPPPPPSDFSFAPSETNAINLSTPPSDQVLGKISSDVFREMAEMERENNALMLQLKREQLRSEIDALKTSNRQTLFDEIERREKMTQARLEWELAQDLKRQEALERKQKAEIRQKQIEAALKREEDRRIQKMKDEEQAQQRKEKEEAEEKERKKQELRKKYDAAALVQAKGLQPALIAATRPAKIKRTASSRVSTQLTATGDEMLTKKKAGEALTVSKSADDDDNSEKLEREPASSLYAVTEIRGTAGTLIAKLISKKDKATFFAKQSTILPTGHTVVSIDKDFVIVQIGDDKEMIGFPSAGLLSENPAGGSSADTKRARPAPMAVKKSSLPSFSGAALAR
ncbi:MAG: hypothetical protein IKR09_05925 [Alphaproteobacteria bacterium]|nr:hypothetical protein [Alphaproteobacteria bacterium]